MENKFRTYFDKRTAGMGRSQRAKEKEIVAQKLGISVFVLNNWLLGYTVPNKLEQKAVNSILGEKIY